MGPATGLLFRACFSSTLELFRTDEKPYRESLFDRATMGAGQSTPEDVLKIVNEPVSYMPPLEVNPTNPVCYFDIQLGRYGDATKLGRITMELKADVTPKTAENFKQLCLADEGNGYKGSRFHRVIPQFMVRDLPSARVGPPATHAHPRRRRDHFHSRHAKKARAFSRQFGFRCRKGLARSLTAFHNRFSSCFTYVAVPGR